MTRLLVICVLSLSAPLYAQAESKAVYCVMNHSAVAGLDEERRIDVHTRDDDEIEVTLQGIGLEKAVFNDTYKLSLVKEDSRAYYYAQPSPEGFIMWVYFKASNTITYAKS